MSRNCFCDKMIITPENGYLKEYAFLYSYICGLANDSNNVRFSTHYKKIDIPDNSYIEMEYNTEKGYDFFTYHKNNLIIQFRNFKSDSVMIEVAEIMNDGKSDVHFFPCNEFFIQNIFYKVMEDISEIFKSEIITYKQKDDASKVRILYKLGLE